MKISMKLCATALLLGSSLTWARPNCDLTITIGNATKSPFTVEFAQSNIAHLWLEGRDVGAEDVLGTVTVPAKGIVEFKPFKNMLGDKNYVIARLVQGSRKAIETTQQNSSWIKSKRNHASLGIFLNAKGQPCLGFGQK